MESIKVEHQPGPQTEFGECDADIAIYGGAAGGGKSFALLLEPLYHVNNKLFQTVVFRRNTTQVRNPGGLWDESYNLYKMLKAHPREAFLEWIFPKGMQVKFAHLEHEKSVYDWQGSQIPLICFDELTHFSEAQFFYMLSRNRSMSGVPGYIRATCNPDCDSWVRKFIDWWIDPDGYPIPERSGVIRWFIRVDEKIMWADTPEELTTEYGAFHMPKSFTFIAAKVTDNKILMDKDPAYLSNLHALSRVERLRLKDGNWNVRASAGMFFQKQWFPIVDAIPTDFISCVRYWDRAATKPNEQNKDPDYTVGLKLYKLPNGQFVVGDMRRIRDTPLKVEQLIKTTASHDGPTTTVYLEQDPGSSGVADVDHMVRELARYVVRVAKVANDKVTRAKAVSAQSEFGNIKVLRAPWNDDFFTELENFSQEVADGKTGHDDIVDTLSGAFNESCSDVSILDLC